MRAYECSAVADNHMMMCVSPVQRRVLDITLDMSRHIPTHRCRLTSGSLPLSLTSSSRDVVLDTTFSSSTGSLCEKPDTWGGQHKDRALLVSQADYLCIMTSRADRGLILPQQDEYIMYVRLNTCMLDYGTRLTLTTSPVVREVTE